MNSKLFDFDFGDFEILYLNDSLLSLITILYSTGRCRCSLKF